MAPENEQWAVKVHAPERLGNSERSISEFLAIDRTALMAQWRQIIALVKTCELSHETLHVAETGYLDVVKKELTNYVRDLRNNLCTEETLLVLLKDALPEVATGASPRSLEYRQIQEFLGQIELALDACTCAAVIQAVESLVEKLPNLLKRREEQIDYVRFGVFRTRRERSNSRHS